MMLPVPLVYRNRLLRFYARYGICAWLLVAPVTRRPAVEVRDVMLRITPEQMAIFSREAQTNFLGRVAIFIKSQFQEAAGIPDADLVAEVGELVGTAQSYDLSSEREILSYLLAAKFLGLEFV
jgi:hypothetical protein